MEWSPRAESWLEADDLAYVKGHVVMTDAQLYELQCQIFLLLDLNTKLKALKQTHGRTLLKNQGQQQGLKYKSVSTKPKKSSTRAGSGVLRRAQQSKDSCGRQGIMDHTSSGAGARGLSEGSKRGNHKGRQSKKRKARNDSAPTDESPSTSESLATLEEMTMAESIATEKEASSAEVEGVSRRVATQAPTRRSLRKRKAVSYVDTDQGVIPKGKAKGYTILEDEGGKEQPVILPSLKPVVYKSEGDKLLCSTCWEGESSDPSNAMICCSGDGCGVGAHLQCHGLEDAPLGQWLCDGCRDGLSPADANCVLCPVVGGALKKVHSLGDVKVPQKLPDRLYVHLVCALWVDEVHFLEPDRLSGILLDKMTHVRAGLKCAICKQAGGGAIQCRYGNCCRAFHPLCARSKGWVVAFCADGTTAQFCGRHSTGAAFAAERQAILDCGGAGSTTSTDGGASSAAGGGDDSESPNEYEEERKKNIERNRSYLQELRDP